MSSFAYALCNVCKKRVNVEKHCLGCRLHLEDERIVVFCSKRCQDIHNLIHFPVNLI